VDALTTLADAMGVPQPTINGTAATPIAEVKA
jgi:hypothetical protein